MYTKLLISTTSSQVKLSVAYHCALLVRDHPYTSSTTRRTYLACYTVSSCRRAPLSLFSGALTGFQTAARYTSIAVSGLPFLLYNEIRSIGSNSDFKETNHERWTTAASRTTGSRTAGSAAPGRTGGSASSGGRQPKQPRRRLSRRHSPASDSWSWPLPTRAVQTRCSMR